MRVGVNQIIYGISLTYKSVRPALGNYLKSIVHHFDRINCFNLIPKKNKEMEKMNYKNIKDITHQKRVTHP